MSLLQPPRRPLLMPAWARNSLWRQAAAVPSLDLNFAVTKNIGPLVSFTRASSGTFVDSAGVLQTAVTDAPRFDHDPTTTESLGLLVEEQRTNSIRNNTMVGAVAGTPGTLPTNWSFSGAGTNIEVVGTGSENGINYIDVRFSGTATNTNLNFETTTSASASQTWAASCYFKLISGTFTGNWRLTCNEFAVGNNFLRTGFVQTFTPTNASLSTQRVAGSFTTGASTATISVLINCAGAATSVDFTIRIGLPQLEQGAFATSVIPTTTAAATRAADVASITGSAFSSWYRQDEGSFFVSHDARQVLLVANNNSFNERQPQMGLNAALIHDFFNITGGVIQANNTGLAHVIGTTSRAAYTYKTNDFIGAVNGSLTTSDSSGSVSSSVSQLNIGVFQNGGNGACGTLRRICFWPTRLADSTLQAITQP